MSHFTGVGGLLGSRALLGGQVAGIAAGQQDAELRRQQEFLNFFRVQQQQQQAGQFQQQQAFREAMFRETGFERQRRFGLDVERAIGLQQFRTGQLELQGLRARGAGARAGEAAEGRFRKLQFDAVDPESSKFERRQARTELVEENIRRREAGAPEIELEARGLPVIPEVLQQVETGLRGTLGITAPGLQPARLAEATPEQIIGAIPQTFRQRTFGGGIRQFGQSLLAVSGLPGVESGENVIAARTGFTREGVQQNILQLEDFLARIARKPKSTREEQAGRIRRARVTLTNQQILLGMFQRARQFNVIPRVGQLLGLGAVEEDPLKQFFPGFFSGPREAAPFAEPTPPRRVPLQRGLQSFERPPLQDPRIGVFLPPPEPPQRRFFRGLF